MLGRTLDQSERVLHALAIDPDRRHQHQVLGDVDAVDLHHHDVEAAEIRGHPFLHARS